MITSILFDMDGVLIDSQPMHYEADVETLKHFGVCVTVKDVEKYAGTTNSDRYTRFKKDYHMDDSVEAMVAFREQCIMDMIRSRDISAIDGIRELLKDIRCHHLKTAVASSSSYDLIYAVLDKLSIRDCFDQVVSGEDLENSKPAPDIFLKTAHQLESDPEECVVIEDSGNGVLAGIRAGMRVVGYVNPTSGKQDLSPATRVITSFLEITANDLMKLS
ncbi:MAG TPA: HAD family phosphatase [Candidatus Scybalocola faecavium]|nr:HAD family phosphatase [Candidatus Scybalocola faecavium]